tara:strand:+ start:479 stop:829 length:351 start_codon:yes stop_codon:yes gene_type:complete
MSRINNIVKELVGIEHPDDLMLDLMQACNNTVTPAPDVGKFYIFVYNPKTPRIRYDQNPLVAVTDIFIWGFRGINFHWDDYRQYTWKEVAGQLYEVYDDELTDLEQIPFANFKLNS